MEASQVAHDCGLEAGMTEMRMALECSTELSRTNSAPAPKIQFLYHSVPFRTVLTLQRAGRWGAGLVARWGHMGQIGYLATGPGRVRRVPLRNAQDRPFATLRANGGGECLRAIGGMTLCRL